MQSIIGDHFLSTSQPNDILGHFNSSIANKTFIFLDEARLEEQHQEQVRALTTGRQHRQHSKNVDVKFVQSYHNMWFATNNAYKVYFIIVSIL